MFFRILLVAVEYPFVFFITVSALITIIFGALASSMLYATEKSYGNDLRRAYAYLGLLCSGLILFAVIFTRNVLRTPYEIEGKRHVCLEGYACFILEFANIDSAQLVAIFIFGIIQIFGMSAYLIREILRSKRENDKKLEIKLWFLVYIYAILQILFLVASIGFLWFVV